MKKPFIKSFLLLSIGLILAAFVGDVISTATGFNPLAVSAVIFGAGLFAVAPANAGYAFSALSITALNTALGAYFRKDKGVLISKMLLGMNVEDRMEIWDDCKDQVPLPNLTISDLVKPANPTTFAPTSNALAFGARILQVRPWKVDLQIVPQTLEKSWLGQYKKKGSDVYDMPFEEYIMGEIVKMTQDNLRLKALFKGVYNGSGTAPVDIMDGLLKLIADEITATTITPTTTGVISSSNVITKVEAVYDALGEAYKATETQMLCSPTIFDWYVRLYRATYGGTTTYTGVAKDTVLIDGTLCSLKREPGMAGSQRLICTSKSNIVYGVDTIGEESNINSQVFDRTIKLMIDAKAGIQFKSIAAEALAVNEQA
jgi:hypothetical protein